MSVSLQMNSKQLLIAINYIEVSLGNLEVCGTTQAQMLLPSLQTDVVSAHRFNDDPFINLFSCRVARARF